MSAPAPRRLATRLSADALRQVRGGHPWVYADAITSIDDGGRPGDLAVVFDDKRRFAAIGLYDPDSPIRIKVLHRGRPTPIDRAWWIAQVAAAADRRAALASDPATTAWRVVHGDNDGLPGLVVDRYDDTAVVKLYAAALVPHLDDIVAAVDAALAPTRVVLRASRLVGPYLPQPLADGVALRGEVPTEPVAYLENGLAFAAEVVRGQKTGAFLDQRDNRALVAAHADGARVLDVFCCTGGFGVHAAAGGASAVHFVDQSAGAIDTARDNIERNRAVTAVAVCPVTSEVGDAFAVMESLAATGRRFDIVVVDPPSFAPRQAAVPAALGAYRRLTALALRLVEPDGLLFQASCSSRVTPEQFIGAVHAGAHTAGVTLAEIVRTGHPADHPIGFPQGAYLKAVLARVPRRRPRRPS